MAETKFCKAFGEELRTRRERLVWTQSRLAEESGVHEHTIANYENAKVMPMASKRLKLIEAINDGFKEEKWTIKAWPSKPQREDKRREPKARQVNATSRIPLAPDVDDTFSLQLPPATKEWPQSDFFASHYVNEIHTALKTQQKCNRRVVVLHGLSGTGKSFLAYNLQRSNDIWVWTTVIHCTTAETIRADLDELGNAWERPLDRLNVNGRVLLEYIGMRVGKKNRWLLILDDAQNQQIVHALLPRSENVDVIITSTNSTWTIQTKVEVKYLNQDEGVACIKHLLGPGHWSNSDIDVAKRFVNAFQGLIFALAMLCGLVRSRGCSLSDLENEIGTEDPNLNTFQRDPWTGKSLQNLFDAGIHSISKEEGALALLTIFSLLHYEAIPLKQISAIPEDVDVDQVRFALSNERRWRAIESLRQFSLIDVKADLKQQETLVYIHKLVQRAVIKSQSEMTERITWPLLRGLSALFKHGWQTQSSYLQLLPLWPHASALLQKVDCTKSPDPGTNQALRRLLTTAAAVENFNMRFEPARRFLNKWATVPNAPSATEAERLLFLEVRKAVFIHLGEYDAAIDCIKEAIDLSNNCIGPGRREPAPLTLNWYSCLGCAYRLAGRPEQAVKEIEIALKGAFGTADISKIDISQVRAFVASLRELVDSQNETPPWAYPGRWLLNLHKSYDRLGEREKAAATIRLARACYDEGGETMKQSVLRGITYYHFWKMLCVEGISEADAEAARKISRDILAGSVPPFSCMGDVHKIRMELENEAGYKNAPSVLNVPAG